MPAAVVVTASVDVVSLPVVVVGVGATSAVVVVAVVPQATANSPKTDSWVALLNNARLVNIAGPPRVVRVQRSPEAGMIQPLRIGGNRLASHTPGFTKRGIPIASLIVRTRARPVVE
jgi:hypothetical protein